MGQLEDLGFHVTDGFTVKRSDSGKVRIRKYKDSMCKDLVFEMILQPSSWAFVVASVCARGETSETYHEQKKFHDQKPEVKNESK